MIFDLYIYFCTKLFLYIFLLRPYDLLCISNGFVHLFRNVQNLSKPYFIGFSEVIGVLYKLRVFCFFQNLKSRLLCSFPEMILEFLLPKFVIVFVSVTFGRHKNTLLHLSFYVQRHTFLIKWTQGLVMPFPLGADDDVCLVGAHRLLPLWMESASGLS
jgi:hypothetical protein